MRDEPDRYNLGLDFGGGGLSDFLRRPSARLALLMLGPLATAYAVARARRGSAPHRLLALTLVALVIELALFESTKRFVYWVVVVPFLCVAIADGALALWRWRPSTESLRRLAIAGAAVCALISRPRAPSSAPATCATRATPPAWPRPATSVREVVPEGSVVLTDNRMWPALRDLQPRSLLLLFYWTNPDIAGEELTDIPGAMQRTQARYLLLSPVSKELLTHLSPHDSELLNAYVKQHGTLKAIVAQPPYGPIEVYELRP